MNRFVVTAFLTDYWFKCLKLYLKISENFLSLFFFYCKKCANRARYGFILRIQVRVYVVGIKTQDID